MSAYTQKNRPLAITTPLGEDVLLLKRFQGHEAISQLFSFQVDLLAEAQNDIRFDRILGQSVTVKLRLADDEKRYFNGIVNRFSQSDRDDVPFVHFRAEIVPKLWLLTKKVRSRIFHHLSIPDILRQVLTGLNVTYQFSVSYYPRDYCVQYCESDFDFVSRLMEEEGIYYFFEHSESKHQMIVTDAPKLHPSVSGTSDVIYERVLRGDRDETRIWAWEKTQELRSGEYTVWDHCFELPGNHLEGKQETLDSVGIGKATHKLKIGGNDKLEIYEYPGGFAQRFDGIDDRGAPRPKDLQEIFRDRERTVGLRMEQEQALSLEIAGAGNCGQFLPGHKFTLKHHFDADDQYLLTRVEHDAHCEFYRSGDAPPRDYYENRFRCIPAALPYRPQCVTREPVIAGIQTATVVGPAGEEIFCDKYGRIKVQFHWDREGKMDGDNSCWLRVAQAWAGRGWGAFFWPRIGHEVVVVFEEGDPDQPLIVGSVYNAENMPWFKLPSNKQLGGFKSASLHGTANQNYNGIVFNDKKDHEHLSIHSERNMSLNAEYDKMTHAGRHKGERVSGANVLTVGRLSSGGSTDGGGFDAGDTIDQPPPKGGVGLHSVTVFGQHHEHEVGLKHELAVGSNIQICINPAGLAAGVPGGPGAPALTAELGSGLGGDMQFTVGTSANFVLGQEFDINLGPDKIQISGHYGDHAATVILCGMLGAIAIAWGIVHDTMPDDGLRASLVINFQKAVDTLLVTIMAVEMSLKAADKSASNDYKKLCRVGPEFQRLDDSDWGSLSFGAGAASVAALLAPVLVIANEKGED
jgi:type VI secretion system secreted protein VgrG